MLKNTVIKQLEELRLLQIPSVYYKQLFRPDEITNFKKIEFGEKTILGWIATVEKVTDEIEFISESLFFKEGNIIYCINEEGGLWLNQEGGIGGIGGYEGRIINENIHSELIKEYKALQENKVFIKLKKLFRESI